MAALIGVCLVLALWMTGSRSPAGRPARLPDSGRLWDRAYPEISADALRYRKLGDLRSAERAYRQGFQEAARRRDKLATLRFLIGVGTSNAIASLRLRITEMEAGAGLGFAVKKGENFRIQSSLNHFQAGLGESELFLTFLLEGDSSYVWAVSRESLHLYRFPTGMKIAAEVKTFREAVLSGEHPVEERQGRRLYEDLFGPLDSHERFKKDWLLSVEDVLFEVTFAEPVERRGGKSVYLVERRSIQVVPGALLLGRSTGPSQRGGWFLGVGDPIYNLADSRWSAPRFWTGRQTGSSWAAGAPGQLTRLVAPSAHWASCQLTGGIH